ncbi:MAG: hypothetical protein K2Y20_03085 [Sphingomonas sp.]|nr:hypothetical protein [Sphingomonas sp.]
MSFQRKCLIAHLQLEAHLTRDQEAAPDQIIDRGEGAVAVVRVSWLGRVGYDPVYGARPLKRAVQRYLQDPLADLILSGGVKDGQAVHVEDGEGALKLTIG